MRVDTHIHLYDPRYGDFSWPPVGSPYHRLLDMNAYSQAHGGSVDKAVVIGCSSEPALNQAILETCEPDPRVGAYIAQLDVTDPTLTDHTKTLASYGKYRGFRFANRQGFAADAQQRIAAAGTGGIVEILGDWHDTAKLTGFCAAHPEIIFVVEHFGGYLFSGEPLPSDYRQFLAEMAAIPHVHLKLSGILTLARVTPKPTALTFYQDAFSAAVAAFGVNRCLFGSDWPVLGAPYAVALNITTAFCDNLEPGATAKIMGRNAQLLYQIT